MEIGTQVWVWEASGDIIKGVYVGKDNGWLKVDTNDYILFKKPNHIFQDFETACAWQIVKRVKRLLRNGVPMDLTVDESDKPALQKAMDLFPEELI